MNRQKSTKSIKEQKFVSQLQRQFRTLVTSPSQLLISQNQKTYDHPLTTNNRQSLTKILTDSSSELRLD